MKMRPDLLDADSPKGIEVVQLTDEAVRSSHVYMEAQVFPPDSKRLILHRSATAHGSDRHDPEHRYLLCDLEDRCRLSVLTTEQGATGPSLSPDGKTLYYLVDETDLNAGRLTLRKVNLDGTGRETLLVIDAPLPGTTGRPSKIYPLSTIRSDGRKLATAAFLGTAHGCGQPFGLLVFDLVDASVDVVLQGASWCNLHPQYCRAPSGDAVCDIMVQENHGNEIAADGTFVRLTSGPGADIHLIRDDGTDFRSFPWGRNGKEYCQGHQCWRGRTTWAITSTEHPQRDEAQLIEGQASPFADHVGLNTPGAYRNDLSRLAEKPRFFHFATDAAGARLITDQGHYGGERLFVARLGVPGRDPSTEWTYLLRQRTSNQSPSHSHPFLSPDGTMGFFNSDESGRLQAYMVRGF